MYVSCSPLAVGAADAQEAPICSNPQNKQGEQHLLVEAINPKSAPTFSANRIRPEETATIFTELDLACSNRYSANPEITCNDRPASVQLIRATLAGGIVFCVYARHKPKKPYIFPHVKGTLKHSWKLAYFFYCTKSIITIVVVDNKNKTSSLH